MCDFNCENVYSQGKVKEIGVIELSVKKKFRKYLIPIFYS